MAMTPDSLNDEDDNNQDCSLDEKELHPSTEHTQLQQPPAALVSTTTRVAPLSHEALRILQLASTSVVIQSPILRPLYKQLEVLRARVRTSRSSQDSCVIADALEYLELLRNEAHRLRVEKQEIPAESTKTLQDLTALIIQVNPVNHRLHVHVSCSKNTGLIANLLEAVEGLGAILDEVNVTCDAKLVMDAQIHGIPTDGDTVRRVKHALRSVFQH